MKLATLTVNAGMHERRWCPVHVTLDGSADASKLTLKDLESGKMIPVQGWSEGGNKLGVAFIIEQMAPKTTRKYELGVGDKAAAPSVVVAEEAAGKLRITVGGEYFTTYNYGPEVVRPYLYPVYTEGGVGMTRDWPMKDAPEDSHDHIHHKGIYSAQGEVNGVDNWGEGPNHGWQIHKGFERTYSGPVAGGFTALNDWTTKDRQTNMTETRRVTVYNTPAGLRLVDYETAWHASEGEVTLGDTKEGGILSIRVPSVIEGQRPDGGLIVNGVGSKTEAETWGKRAQWCDYSGMIKGKPYGITILDHDTNPRYPTHWHVRNYGLFTANPFGIHDYTADPKNLSGAMVIPAGQTATWKYRIVIHTGDADSLPLHNYFQDFIHPPKVEVELG